MTNSLFFRRPPTLTDLVSLIVLSVAASSVGCGGDDDGDSGSSSGQSTTGIDLTAGDLGDPTGGGNSIENSDGGRVDLSADQVRVIDDAACTGWVGEGESLPAVLQLVVDTSRSMTQDAPGSNDSKWDVTRDALSEAIANLPASVSVGLMFYPNTPELMRGESSASPITACVGLDGILPIDFLGGPGSDHRTAIDQRIEAVDPEGYTPTHDAYRYALRESLIPYPSSAGKFMLLITDGAPTVNTDCVSTEQGGGGNGALDAETQPIVDEIEQARTEHGIRTFLIGSPGSEQSADGMADMRPWLSEAATLGGTAASGCQVNGPEYCHMDMTQEADFASALTAGLANVVGQIVSACEFSVPEPPEQQDAIDPDETNLIISWSDGTASLILPDGMGDCTDGWQWNEGSGTVSLCGLTCDEVQLDEGARVQLTFGCTTDEIVVPIR